MPRKYTSLDFKKRIRIIKNAGIRKIKVKKKEEIEGMETLQKRVKKIFELKENLKKDKTKMLFFVMYDIEDDKVRKEIAKYLESKGCVRIQKSIFFASAHRDIFREIHQTIKEVQEYYENHDSIIIVPVSTDEIRSMKIIGKNIDFDIVMNKGNTLFF